MAWCITIGSIIGGYVAAGGHLYVLWQPYEFVIILGSAIGAFFVANPLKVVKDTGNGIMEAIKEAVPKKQEYLDLLSLLYSLHARTAAQNPRPRWKPMSTTRGIDDLPGISRSS